ncbi:MAG: hypothetical protein K0R39_2352 [Symbiobacteriaceae bacterium]|nr:hypothetical protein [Symbiobacteriaceae bacterium]
MMPAFFLAHGSPMIALEDTPYTRKLRAVGSQYRPTAIILFSAHWESSMQAVGASETYRTIYDFGGFPEALYGVTYPAHSDAALVQEISALLDRAGVQHRIDQSRGLDHGAWTLLRHLYPDADVPVVAMSVDANLLPAEQYRIGQALAELRARDVMVIGSGVTVHNFGTIRFGAAPGQPDAWAKEFDDWVFDKLTRWETQALFAYESQAPHAQKAVPPNGNEHFVPLFYTMGAAHETPSVKELHRHYEFGNLSYVLWQFGE